ncbi:MAG: DUF2255 family protein [Deltaproteobacteria bacterium]|nr:DUF2255 family protein [Deltaproteobacteria bacterium]MBW2446461.1 DUF2255 family protein [Deltaproteobacteria bacterium]
MSPLRFALAATLAGPLLFGGIAAATDWEVHADAEVVEVVTTDAGGAKRKTKVWMAVLDGEAYIRTGGSTWGQNVERDANVRILAGSEGYDLRAEFVTDDAARERITKAFRAKYGWFDRLVSPIRGGRPKIMRLVDRGDE